MNTQPVANETALHAFLSVWSGDLAADMATRLKCSEVDSLARLLRTHGHPAAAAAWINFHSHGDDDEDDAHRRTPAAAMWFELDMLTATYPDIAQEYEEPEAFGAGHVVLYSRNGRQRFAITEQCDKPDDDETREPIAWQWGSAHRLLSGGWQLDTTDSAAADDLATFTAAAWQWAEAHGGPRGR